LVKAVMAVESAFQPDAISPKGAHGLMQVIPDTAERYGVVGDRKKSTGQKLLDPTTNITVGIQHLANLMTMFKSNLELVLAAYNAGEGNVQKYAMKIPPFPETQEYVKLVKQFYAGFQPAKKEPVMQVAQAAVPTKVAVPTVQIKWSASVPAPAVVVPLSMATATAMPLTVHAAESTAPATASSNAPASRGDSIQWSECSGFRERCDARRRGEPRDSGRVIRKGPCSRNGRAGCQRARTWRQASPAVVAPAVEVAEPKADPAASSIS
jgi:hypothetical protein